MENRALLGYDPRKRKPPPVKGNLLLTFVEERPESFDEAVESQIPVWKTMVEQKGENSLEAVTEAYFRSHISPLLNNFIQSCMIEMPLFIDEYAGEYFTGKKSVKNRQTVKSQTTRDEYKIAYIKPATTFVMKPLVHVLMQNTPRDARDFTSKNFQSLSDA